MKLADRNYFERSVAEHRPAMVAAAQSVLHDAGAAEDVVQDVLLQLWTKPQRFDPSRGSLRHYLTMLARSRALDRWRSRAALASAVDRATAQASQEGDVTHESAAEPVIRRESAREAMSALATLPDTQREALILTFGADMTMWQLANAVDIPLGTAKSRVRIGLQKARLAMTG